MKLGFGAEEGELPVILTFTNGQSVCCYNVSGAIGVFIDIVFARPEIAFVHWLDLGNHMLWDRNGSAIPGQDFHFAGILADDFGDDFLTVVFGDSKIFGRRVGPVHGGKGGVFGALGLGKRWNHPKDTCQKQA